MIDCRLKRHELGFLQIANMPTALELEEYYSLAYIQEGKGSYSPLYSPMEEDSVRGLLEGASLPEVGGPVNQGIGEERSVSDVLESPSEHFPQASIRHESSDALFEASQADTSRLKAYLSWAPEYELEQGISEIIRHELSKKA